MYSVGLDLLKIERIQAHIDRGDRFFERFYGEQERAELSRRGWSAETAAGMFCAKEAFSKALGTGVIGFSLNEVQLLHNEAGAPYFALSGRAKEIADSRGLCFSVSISHTEDTAGAVVIASPKAP